MTRSLLERVVDFVVANPGMTQPEIARGVRARDIEIRDILSSELFSASVRDVDQYRSPQVYRFAPGGADGLGRRQRKSQCDLIALALADGQWHLTSSIHDRCGYSRLNSRIAELRSRRGMMIECRHVDGASRGADAYEYRFTGYQEGFGPSEAADSIAVDATAPAPGGESVASDGPAVKHGSPDHLLTEAAGLSDEQLGLDEAA